MPGQLPESEPVSRELELVDVRHTRRRAARRRPSMRYSRSRASCSWTPEAEFSPAANRSSGCRDHWGTAKLGYFLSPYDDIQPIFGNAPTLTTSILSTGALWAQAYLGPALAGGFDGRLAEFDSLRLADDRGIQRQRPVQHDRRLARRRTAASSASAASTTTARCSSAPRTSCTTRSAARPTRRCPTGRSRSRAAISSTGVRLGAVYERLRYDATPSTDLTRDFYGIGVTIDVGPGLLFLYWGHAGDGKGSAADGSNVGGLVKGVNTGASQWEVSYTYLLSARTLALRRAT